MKIKILNKLPHEKKNYKNHLQYWNSESTLQEDRKHIVSYREKLTVQCNAN